MNFFRMFWRWAKNTLQWFSYLKFIWVFRKLLDILLQSVLKLFEYSDQINLNVINQKFILDQECPMELTLRQTHSEMQKITIQMLLARDESIESLRMAKRLIHRSFGMPGYQLATILQKSRRKIKAISRMHGHFQKIIDEVLRLTKISMKIMRRMKRMTKNKSSSKADDPKLKKDEQHIDISDLLWPAESPANIGSHYLTEKSDSDEFYFQSYSSISLQKSNQEAEHSSQSEYDSNLPQLHQNWKKIKSSPQ